jgi:hypothetical protein
VRLTLADTRDAARRPATVGYVDLVRVGGLGLAGPGAAGVIRALLVDVLTGRPSRRADEGPRVLISTAGLGCLGLPAATLAALDRLVVTGSHGATVAAIEEHVSRRGTEDAPPLLVVVPRDPTLGAPQVVAVGRPRGIAVVLIGTHPVGATMTIGGAGELDAIVPPGLATGIGSDRTATGVVGVLAVSGVRLRVLTAAEATRSLAGACPAAVRPGGQARAAATADSPREVPEPCGPPVGVTGAPVGRRSGGRAGDALHEALRADH